MAEQLIETVSLPVGASERPWKILVVDDDPFIQYLTGRVLAGMTFKGRATELHSARSLEEARTILAGQDGFAVALIDVLLGKGGYGFELITHIREELGDHNMRIILRTGHPELAIERSVVERYEINDYRTKDELTPDRLYCVVVEALRGYDNILTILAGRRDLVDTMTAVGTLFDLKSPRHFYMNMLLRLNGMVRAGADSLLCTSASALDPGGDMTIRAATGRFGPLIGHPLEHLQEPEVVDRVRSVITGEPIVQTAEDRLFRMVGRKGEIMLVYCRADPESDRANESMVNIFLSKAGAVWTSIELVEELGAVQHAIVRAFAFVAGYKDHSDTHLSRIERLSSEIASELFLRRVGFADEVDEVLVDKIGPASVLHDVGMFSIPDDILASTEELIEEDFEIIAKHALRGYEILSNAAAAVTGRNLLSIAAEICRYHHERYDGSGYPEGLKGRAIPISARIVGVADVFESLISPRVHRSAWPVEDAVALVVKRAGKEFDPDVVEAFNTVIARIKVQEPEWFLAAAESVVEAEQSGLRGVWCRLVRRFRAASS